MLMTSNHIHSPLAKLTLEPIGYVSSPEGFVLISSFLTGMIHTRRMSQHGFDLARRTLWQRAAKLYLTHLVLVLFGVAMAGVFGDHLQPLRNIFTFAAAEPWTAFLRIPLLLYQPPMFDILAIFVVFLLISPWLLRLGRDGGWGWLGLGSLSLWLVAQTAWANPLSKFTSIDWSSLGSFNLLAWQLLWVLGLWLGQCRATGHTLPLKKVRRWTWLALSGAIFFFLWRRNYLPIPGYGSVMEIWLDKWTLAPLRLLNVAFLLIVVLAWNPKNLPTRLSGYFILLGKNSLDVYVWHIPLVIFSQWLILLLDTPTSSVAVTVCCFALLPMGAVFRGYVLKRSSGS